MDLQGEAVIPIGGFFEPITGERTLTYNEIAHNASGANGWKFHLNFDPDSIEQAQPVRSLLQALQAAGCITSFKIGEGGGITEGQPGKEATVYVGHRDKANIVAEAIETSIGGILSEPAGDALRDDIPFTNHVLGRFEVWGIDQTFDQYGYGAQGFPILHEEKQQLMRDEKLQIPPEEYEAHKLEAYRRSEAILRERYGVYYTGSTQIG